MLVFSVTLFFIAGLHSQTADETRSCSFVKTELYFGPVTLAAWSDFLAREVTPRFPQGLTWLDVHGQWRDSTGSVRKLDSRLLIIIYPPSHEARRKIEEIRTDFKEQFHQKSVLSVTESVDASF